MNGVVIHRRCCLFGFANQRFKTTVKCIVHEGIFGSANAFPLGRRHWFRWHTFLRTDLPTQYKQLFAGLCRCKRGRRQKLRIEIRWRNRVLAGTITQAVPGGKYQSIDVGKAHACALRTDGKAVCWGTGAALVAIREGRFSQIEAASARTCVLENNNASCWGLRVFSMVGSYVALSAGAFHLCALQAHGLVVCSGTKLPDDGETTPPANVPFSQISCGYHRSCGIDIDGFGRCWGKKESNLDEPPRTTKLKQINSGWYTIARLMNLMKSFAGENKIKTNNSALQWKISQNQRRA